MPGEDPASADGILARLAGWAAAERVTRAASERSRTRSLLMQAASTSTWSGVLVELAERGAEVALGVADRRLAGRLSGVGRDFLVLERHAGGPLVVALHAVARLEQRDGGPPACGSRQTPLDLTLGSVLEAVAGEAAPVSVWTAAGRSAGSISGVGEDVIALRPEAPAGAVAHIPLLAVQYVELR